jgi:hypothetical protein
MEMLDETFAREVDSALDLYEKMIGHAAGRTRPMIERLGKVGALSRLVVSADLQTGFKALRDSNQLEISFEAIVVRHKSLFQQQVVQAAKWRLEHPHDLL